MIDQNLKRRMRKAAETERAQLLMRQPFIGMVIMSLDLVSVCDPRLHTAATDGKHIFFDCNFYRNLKGPERLFLLAHETWHCVLLHFFRQGDRDNELWNLAADLEIQFILMKENGLKNPCPLPYLPDWNDLSAEEIYEQLRKHNKNTDRGINADKHLHCDFQDNEEYEEFDPNYQPNIEKETADRIREHVSYAVQHYERRLGTLPEHIKTLLETTLKPKLGWKELLAQFVTGVYGSERRWLPPSRRHISRGLYLPSFRTESLKAVVAVDTSASTIDDRNRVFSELTSLLSSFGQYEITLLECDIEICHVEKFDNNNPIASDHSWIVTGGRGTDFRPVFEYIEKNRIESHILIFFTDGYGNVPNTPPLYPVLWLLTEYGHQPAIWGVSVKLKKEQQ